jgi:hypothetical protein
LHVNNVVSRQPDALRCAGRLHFLEHPSIPGLGLWACEPSWRFCGRPGHLLQRGRPVRSSADGVQLRAARSRWPRLPSHGACSLAFTGDAPRCLNRSCTQARNVICFLYPRVTGGPCFSDQIEHAPWRQRSRSDARCGHLLSAGTAMRIPKFSHELSSDSDLVLQVKRVLEPEQFR